MSPSQPPEMSSSSPSSSPSWLSIYIKLKFFARIRRFLRSKTMRKQHRPSDQFNIWRTGNIDDQVVEVMESTSEKEEEDIVVLQRSVKKLHFGSWEEKETAAKEIERLAKENVKRRKVMAELGVVPVLVAMAATEVVERRRVAVRALIELANGTYTNKALMVDAGLLSKLPKNINGIDESTRQDFSELILSLSCLANTHFPLASSEILPFALTILDSNSTAETKQSCLGALYNLSTILDNAGPLVSNGAVHTLLRLSSTKELSEKSLATMANLVVTLMGKNAMESSFMVPEILIDILTWEERPKCQELSAYILMILAHQSSAHRVRMAKAKIVPALLQVALLGSPLAQKRALKLLEWFKDERQVKMGPHSGPQTGRLAIGSPVNQREVEEGKKMMKNLVKQSLYKNLEMITRRANAAAGDSSSKVKALVISTSSKSLPY